MVFFPNAKINLGLFVTGKRPDGYHNIQSILFPVPLYDALELIDAPDGQFGFSQSGQPIGGKPSENLVVKAWQMLQQDFDLPPVKIHLHKNIPTGAGLGGGSADAAYALKLINRHFKLGLFTGAMQMYAGRLGMDCPFFIENIPALATGRGDRLSPVNIDLKGKFLVVVKPDFHISTKAAYGGITSVVPGVSPEEVIHRPVKEWKMLLKNDFEGTVFKRCPEIQFVKNRLYDLGAEFSVMTGSGAAVFALFDHEVSFRSEFRGMFYFGVQI